MPGTILLDQREGVLTITLNRADVLNAFNEQMLRELHDTLRHAARDATLRCVVLIGAGLVFCSAQYLRHRARTIAFSFRDSLRGDFHPIITLMRTTVRS